MLKYLCLVLFVAGTLAAPSNEDFLLKTISTHSERIVGGKDAPAGEFPYQASLRGNNGKTPFCGGTIIAKRFILTAAQCTQRHHSQPKNVQVVVGARLLSSGGTHYALDRIVNHPRFNILTIENDVSVLRTVRSITWTRNIQRIALPESGLPIHGDLLAIVSGWGQTKPGTDTDPASHRDVLQYTNTTTMHDELCARALGAGSKYVHRNTICTSNANSKTGNCRGDTGGPLASRSKPRILLGIISWSRAIGNCGQGLPDVYANVYEHLPFIRAAMEV